jgi:hypothetical protein
MFVSSFKVVKILLVRDDLSHQCTDSQSKCYYILLLVSCDISVRKDAGCKSDVPGLITSRNIGKLSSLPLSYGKGPSSRY